MRLRIALSCILGMTLGFIGLGITAKADTDEPGDFCHRTCVELYSVGSIPYNACVDGCTHGSNVCRAQSSSDCLNCCKVHCASDPTGICENDCILHARRCYITPEEISPIGN